MPLPWKYWLAPTAENVPMALPMCCRSISPYLVLIVKYEVHPPGGFCDQEPDCEVWLNAFNTPATVKS